MISDDLAATIYHIRDEVDALTGRHPNVHEIASRLHMSIRTVYRVIGRRINLSYNQVKVPKGAPRKTTPTQDRHLLSHAKRNRTEPLSFHVNAAGVNLSKTTIWKRLRASKFKAYVAFQDVLSAAQKHVRVQWCLRHRNRNFRKVVLSDETVVVLRKGQSNSMGKVILYRRKDEKFTPQCVLSVPNIQENVSLCVWGCISDAGFGAVRIMRETMNADRYIETLENYLLPSLEYFETVTGTSDWVFQHDNAPPHSAHRTRDWLAEHNIETIDWPPYSPDLNAIEHVWSMLKRKFKRNAPTTAEEAIALIHRIWNDFNREYAQNLMNSMPSKLQFVIDHRGLRK